MLFRTNGRGHRRRRQERAALRAPKPKARVGPSGRVIGVVPIAQTPGAQLLADAGFVDELDRCRCAHSARRPARRSQSRCLRSPTSSINCVNVPGTELGSILCAREGATVYFFSMSTSFTAAALGAEGIGRDVTMIIGNGYAKGHAEIALQTLRDHPKLHAHFNRTYARKLQ